MGSGWTHLVVTLMIICVTEESVNETVLAERQYTFVHVHNLSDVSALAPYVNHLPHIPQQFGSYGQRPQKYPQYYPQPSQYYPQPSQYYPQYTQPQYPQYSYPQYQPQFPQAPQLILPQYPQLPQPQYPQIPQIKPPIRPKPPGRPKPPPQATTPKPPSIPPPKPPQLPSIPHLPSGSKPQPFPAVEDPVKLPDKPPPVTSSEGSCGVRGPSQSFRIVGGGPAKPAEFPWQISLQLKAGGSGKSRHICGGAVLSAFWVVTAAHCIWEIPPSSLSVVAGDYDLYKAEGTEQRVRIDRIIVDKYQRETFSNDIALLQLASPLRIDYKLISPLCLPDPRNKFQRGDSIVAGWGRLSETGSLPHILQYVTLPLISTAKCHNLYRRAGFTQYLHGCQLCSGYDQGGLDSCQGDSGGPLVCERGGRYYLCGIVSWGVGCARPNFPGVYTEVTCFVNWIKQIMNNQANVLSYAPAVVSITPNKPNSRTRDDDDDDDDVTAELGILSPFLTHT